MEKRYLISGVSAVDPYTSIEYESTENGISKTSAQKLFLDGPMINILRKYINLGKPITDIYIYLTYDMSFRKEIYEAAIKSLYKEKNVNITFYPNLEEKLRRNDVQRFGSYYGEIHEIYSKIKKSVKKDEEVILNISSGTPAFEADMMTMAVTNNLIIEQTSNLFEDKGCYELLQDYAKKEELGIADSKINLKLSSRALNKDKFTLLNENKELLEKELESLNKTEENIISRTISEDISQTKKIMLLESIEDSIAKKDYCGLYNCLLDNSQYLDNKEEILKKARNLYYRYIGNDEKALENFSGDDEKLYYPIKNITDDKIINNIIEKFNMMKIKSKREEINDWLLISTPLVEAITSYLASEKLNFGIDFNKIVEENNGKKVISLEKFDEIYPNNEYRENIEKSDGQFFNAIFYKNMIKKKAFLTKDKSEKNSTYDILNKIEIIDLTRNDRVTAAHSIDNVSKEQLEVAYKERFDKKNEERNKKGINSLPEYNKVIGYVEKTFKELIEKTLPNATPQISEWYSRSLKIYENIEENIIELVRNEVYESEEK